jgi:hypothetical protein
MNTYTHTQRAGVIVTLSSVMAAVVAAIAVAFRLPVMLAIVVVLAVVAWLFRSITVEVTPEEIRWQFGGGWLRRRFPLRDVAVAEAVRTTWLDGWGIHYTQHGWLYNVSGSDAVALRFSDGRRVAVGTDDPAGLVSAIAGLRG